MSDVKEIPQEIVEQAWVEIGNLTPRQAMEEMNRLMRLQNALFSFVLEATGDLTKEAHELALYMAVVIYRMYEKAFPPNLPKAHPKDVLHAYEQNGQWLERTARADERIVEERILPNVTMDQPWVMHYVGECLYEPDDEELELSEEDLGQVFIIMKTFVDVLDQCAAGQKSSGAGRQRRGKTQKGKTPATYQLKVTLRGIRPPIWRRVWVPGNISMGTLHDILQITMGWTDSHLHLFQSEHRTIGAPDPEWDEFAPGVIDERRISLSEVAPKGGTKFRYEYDFGDGWEHEVRVEKILPADPAIELPLCLKGKRACPPEDCGGVYGYLDLLEVLADPSDPEHEEMLEWLGGPWDAEAFDRDEVNGMLRDFVSLPE